MSRTLVLATLALIAGCSSPQKRAPMLPDGDEMTEPTGGGEVGPGIVESADCRPDPSPPPSDAGQMSMVAQAEQFIAPLRTEFGAACGAAISVQHEWNAVFQSAGYAQGDSLDRVVSFTGEFLQSTTAYCEGPDGDSFRDNVRAVQVMATDQPDRVGACLDAQKKTIVLRVMLEPRSEAVTGWSGDEIVQWMRENLGVAP